jgi:hypothetical protein
MSLENVCIEVLISTASSNGFLNVYEILLMKKESVHVQQEEE